MVLQNPDESLIVRWVELHPQRPEPDEARLVRYGIPVWSLVGYLEAVDQDVDRAAADYDVPREAVEAAVAYYRRHQGPIDARIAANAA
jgi:uncharacterized protein (DUF433 family)